MPKKREVPKDPPLLWPDGTRRGTNPGLPPEKSMTLGDELSSILGGITEQMVAEHIRRSREKNA